MDRGHNLMPLYLNKYMPDSQQYPLLTLCLRKKTILINFLIKTLIFKCGFSIKVTEGLNWKKQGKKLTELFNFFLQQCNSRLIFNEWA